MLSQKFSNSSKLLGDGKNYCTLIPHTQEEIKFIWSAWVLFSIILVLFSTNFNLIFNNFRVPFFIFIFFFFVLDFLLVSGQVILWQKGDRQGKFGVELVAAEP